MTWSGRSQASEYRAWAFVATAVFPRVAQRLRWPTRLGPAGLLAYVVFSMLLAIAIRGCVLPWIDRLGREHAKPITR